MKGVFSDLPIEYQYIETNNLMLFLLKSALRFLKKTLQIM